MSSPRNRLFSRLLCFFSVFWVAAFSLSLFRIRTLSRRIDSLASSETMLAALSSRVDSLESRPHVVNQPEAEAPGASAVSAARWRVLGSGRSGSWEYTDILFPDGVNLRYYSRCGDDVQARSVAARIVADAECHQSLSSSAFGSAASE